MHINTRITLAEHIVDEPRQGTFRLETVPVPELSPGQVLVELSHLSLDPYMRNRLVQMTSYAQGVEVGEVVIGESVGRVAASRNDDFAAGDHVIVASGWQTHYVSDGTDLRLLPMEASLDPAAFLSVVGMPGFTAWVTLTAVCEVQAGQTVLIPAATGPLGATLGQIARTRGARAVVVVGGEAKVAHARTAYGFDNVIDHRSEAFEEELASACPDGVDIYVDSVGGRVLSAALPLMNFGGRIPVLGTIADYQELTKPSGTNLRPALMRAVLVNRLTVQGVIVYDHESLRDAFEREMIPWVVSEAVRYEHEIYDGLASAPGAFTRLLRGEHYAKVVVRL